MKTNKTILTVLLFILFSLVASNVVADLKKFKSDFKKEEREKNQDSIKDENDEGGCMGAFLGNLLEQPIKDNTEYENQIDDDSKKQNDQRKDELNHSGKVKNEMKSSEYPYLDNFYFTPEAAYQWARDEGNGFHINLSSRIYFIGAEVEGRRIFDGDDHLDFFTFGINIMLYPANKYLMPSVYIQKIFMQGILIRNGEGYGFFFHSFPLKFLHLYTQIGIQQYNNVTFYEYEGRVGFLIYNSYEIFIGYRNQKAKYAELGGPIVGLKFHF